MLFNLSTNVFLFSALTLSVGPQSHPRVTQRKDYSVGHFLSKPWLTGFF